MSLLNNSPTLSYISANGITVIYDKKLYTVQPFNTNKKFVYWNIETPTVFRASNTRPESYVGQRIVLINENGFSTEVFNYDLDVFYDNNNVSVIKENIFGLQEKNEENKEKIVAISIDVDGIRTDVINLEETDTTIKESISTIEQRADKIELSVKDTEKILSSNQLRDDLNNAFLLVNTTLGVFKGEFLAFSKDNAISTTERNEINVHLDLLEESKDSLKVQIDLVKDLAIENEWSDKLQLISNAFEGFELAHTHLKNSVTNSISTGTITPTNLTLVINAFANYSLKLNDLKNTCDNVIVLGTGGTILEKFASLDITAEGIRQEVGIINNGVETNKSLITQTATQIRSEVKAVETSLDGKISTTNSTITQTASQIRAEVKAVETGLDGKITTVSSSLTQTATQIRAEVKAVETGLDGKITTVSSSLTQTASQIRGEITSVKTGLESSLTLSEGRFETLVTNTQEALQTQIKQNSDSLALKVNANGVINAIRLDTSGVKIEASSINLTGYATFSSLSNSGATTINGSNITTGTLNANLVSVINLNASNITAGTITANRVSGGTMLGVVFKTANRAAQVGVEINGNSAYFGNTHIGYGGGHFKIEADRNTSYSSIGDIYLMPGMSGGTATGNGSVRISGHTRTSGRFYSNNIECMTSSVLNGYYGLMAGTSNSNWVRTTSNGILPYTSGSGESSSLGTSAWRFNELHCRAIFENGTQLASKYAALSHTHSNYSSTSHTHTSFTSMLTCSGGIQINTTNYFKYASFYSAYSNSTIATYGTRLNNAMLIGYSSGNLHLVTGAGARTAMMYAVFSNTYSLLGDKELQSVKDEISPLEKLDNTVVASNKIIPITNYKTGENINQDTIFYNDTGDVEININNTIGSLWDICKSLRYENNVLKEEIKEIKEESKLSVEKLDSLENLIKELIKKNDKI